MQLNTTDAASIESKKQKTLVAMKITMINSFMNIDHMSWLDFLVRVDTRIFFMLLPRLMYFALEVNNLQWVTFNMG